MNVSINRQIGSIFIVVGTEVGAGILALPILIAHLGFLIGCLVMLVCWFLMTYTALLLCEVNLAFEDGISFARMASKTTGVWGEVVVWVSFMLLLYMIMVAYISAAGSSLSATIDISSKTASLLFVVILGSFVVFGTATVDWVNRMLLSTKLILLIFVCLILIPNIQISNLLWMNKSFKPVILLSMLPAFVTSFTSHLIIPTLRTYLYSNAKVLARVIIIGSIIPLILYVLWVGGILGVLPVNGSNSFVWLFAHKADPNVGDILMLLKASLSNQIFYTPVSIFSNISVMTSFLGVSLALFGFIIDGFGLKKVKSKISMNLLAIGLTFIIPLLIVWYFPDLFIQALGYVGLCCGVLLVIMPFFMIKKLKARRHQFVIVSTNNSFLLYLALILGGVVVLVQLFVH